MGRYFEIDAVRGAAILLMVLYHTIFCLYFLEIIDWFDPQIFSGAPGAAVFVAIAGISLVLAHRNPAGMVKRGLYILVFATIVSLVTWIVYPQGVVVFGVLHLIGLGTILSMPFLKMKWGWVFAVGVLICLGSFVTQSLSGSPLLLPLGITYPGFTSLDYEPLIPWFGVMLLGVALGKILYPEGKRCSLLSRLPEMPQWAKPMCFLGQHTLAIYIVHVPVILGILILGGVLFGVF